MTSDALHAGDTPNALRAAAASQAAAAPGTAPLRWREVAIQRIAIDTPRVVSVFLPSMIERWDAGQHVDLRLTAADGYTAQRSYSIASAPGAPSIELVIERLDDGEVSPYFHDVAAPGDTIELRGPIGGHFIWRPGDGGPLLLIGGGSGIAPLLSIVRHRTAVAPATPTLLVYSVRSWDDVIHRQELVAMQQHDPHLKLLLTTTRGARQRAGDFDRRLDAMLIREMLASWGLAPQRVYVCGATAFVESVTAALVAEGIAPDRVRAERYGGSGG